jgi:hypothetical protein
MALSVATLYVEELKATMRGRFAWLGAAVMLLAVGGLATVGTQDVWLDGYGVIAYGLVPLCFIPVAAGMIASPRANRFVGCVFTAPVNRFGFSHRHSSIFAAVNPAPQRPAFFSGRLENGQSVISKGFSFLNSSARDAGVKPFRVRAAYMSLRSSWYPMTRASKFLSDGVYGADQAAQACIQNRRIPDRLPKLWQHALFDQVAAPGQRLAHDVASAKDKQVKDEEMQWAPAEP